ncbi:hypothetical protein B0J13DRAFT_558449 [Dactylonectria estremocensis]|uniref:DUF8212 domain-containing protein n=1 Tax=Dactylonectria estremocensis TaxID=1079267 RepID=A0A9P9IXV5_9HYPO|nr:hypothetical protein B0J13DRAFT_558449 [Dactylonectria estremocensis]
MFLDKNQFQSALWFRRGWCLQELIAPREVEFYASNWTELGTKWSLRQAISDTTSIPEAILLQEKRPGDFPVAQRMSWASKRNTTREEDMAYCLLGIFDIHMPLLYGEGSRAFIRLQEEIMRRGIDYSIFLWRSTDRNYGTTGLLCDSPRHFPIEGVPTRSGKLHRYPDITSSKFPIFTSPANNKPPEVTPRGLQMTIHTKKLPDGSRLAWLYQTHEERLVCIFLSPQQSDSKYHRARVGYIEIIGKGQNWDVFQPENMCLETLAELSIPKIPHQSLDFRLYMESTADEKLSLIELYPENGLESHEDGSYGMQIDLAFCPEFFIMVFGVEQNSVTHRFIAAFNMFHGHWACRVHKFDPSTPLADLARQLWDLKPVGEDSDRAISRLPSGTYVTVASKRRSRSCRSFMYVSLVPANISADVHLETQMGGLFDGGNNYIC